MKCFCNLNKVYKVNRVGSSSLAYLSNFGFFCLLPNQIKTLTLHLTLPYQVYPTDGNPVNGECNLVKYPVYKRKCTHEKFWAFHQAHGDILGENTGAAFILLNDKGKSLVNPTFPNVIGIQNMYFDAECEPADPCTIEQQDLCDRVGRQPCQPGSNVCGPEIEVVPPFDDEGSDSDLFF
jgi:hypothetical protein